MTWVPWSSHGMTEFFCKNSVYFYFDKLLFIAVMFVGEALVLALTEFFIYSWYCVVEYQTQGHTVSGRV